MISCDVTQGAEHELLHMKVQTWTFEISTEARPYSKPKPEMQAFKETQSLSCHILVIEFQLWSNISAN